MAAKVFISCGTMPGSELCTATAVKEWLEQQDFCAHVAVTAQNLDDVNSGIVHELRTSDYYLFIDFRRKVSARRRWNWPWPKLYRESLYTHQELALAYCFGFEHCIFLQQEKMESDGIGRYLLTNPIRFREYDDVLSLVQKEVRSRGWTPMYTRHLRPVDISRATLHYPCPYFYPSGNQRNEGIWHCSIENARRDDAATDVLARLNRLRSGGGQLCTLHDRARLKWSLASGYERTLFPEDTDAFDAFALDAANWTDVYLHSARDVLPQQPIIRTAGTYLLDYQVFANGFPRLDFTIQLEVTGNDVKTKARIL